MYILTNMVLIYFIHKSLNSVSFPKRCIYKCHFCILYACVRQYKWNVWLINLIALLGWILRMFPQMGEH